MILPEVVDNKCIHLNNLMIPPTKRYLVDAIYQDIKMRELAIKQHKLNGYKQGILLEGDSGAGKSSLLKAVLEHAGFKVDAVDTQYRYYEMSVGHNDIYNKLLKAFNEGAIVILDELNLDTNIETLLNQLLTGVDCDGRLAAKPGFMIFSSQNPGYFHGRKELSSALFNRCHFMYFDDYSHSDLTLIASTANIPAPESFTHAFFKAHTQSPDSINYRSFFKVLGQSKC